MVGSELWSGYWSGCVVGLLAHEGGHIGAALGLGLRIRKIGLNWLGPYIVREEGPPIANAIVSAAGPLVNLLLAAALWGVWPVFAAANLALGLSNLLPLPKFDGGRILHALSLARTSNGLPLASLPGSRT